MARWFLIDGYNLAFRSFYAIRDLARADGFPTNALHGWVRTLWRLEDDWKPDRLVVFFDLGGDVRREALQPGYKANRDEVPEGLLRQIPVIKDLTGALGYGVVEQAGVEADDLIGVFALARVEAGDEAVIVSADKDLAQCLRPGVTQLLPPPTANPRLGWRVLDAPGVKGKFGVTPAQIPAYLALVGDSVDNIEGLAGVGPKTAAKWLNQYGDLERVIANCGMLKPPRFQAVVHASAERLRENLVMTTLLVEGGAPEVPEARVDLGRALEILGEMEMKRAAADAEKRLSAPG